MMSFSFSQSVFDRIYWMDGVKAKEAQSLTAYHPSLSPFHLVTVPRLFRLFPLALRLGVSAKGRPFVVDTYTPTD
jgi:hypothetical protein